MVNTDVYIITFDQN